MIATEIAQPRRGGKGQGCRIEWCGYRAGKDFPVVIAKFHVVIHQFNQEIKRLSITIDLEAELSPHLHGFVFDSLCRKDRIMGLKDKAKSAAKNLEGKVQEATGDLTGNQEAKVKGKAKQVEAKTQQKVEEVKDEVKESID
jgi:uncharacterized protein YjbJ (UPF0337 family)